ncbi:hypothetical protein BGZ63DRAFT_373894 [Mariannaea sp. PMI_226]|nr:hypothetical protein BGZ63DRAFT_373894 [Mariannaea sp. PMI_226]
MAIPLLPSVQDCGNFSKSVQPYIPQLYALPSQVINHSTSLSALHQLYVETNPLISGFAISVALGFVFLVVSEINRNWSQVDRMWSILPSLYVMHFAAWARLTGLQHSRIDLVALFSVVWSARLTFNYWRRGGYQIGSEDYRWAIVKSQIPGFAFFILNVVFISFIQSILLFAFSGVPAYAILLSNQIQADIKPSDIVFLLLELTLVYSEYVSDGQQWNYQTAKHQYLKDAKVPKGYKQADLDRGFNTLGLWGYSRHPNFLAEQSIWFVLYQWSCFATNTTFGYTFIGSASLILLFRASTSLTESITSSKYSEYKLYQESVGMFFPTSLQPYQTPVRAEKKQN